MQTMVLIQANLDDMTAEHLAFSSERLLQAGAVDAWTEPIVMKKGRAAHTLCCLADPVRQDDLLTIFFRHTTTLGVRIQTVDRAALFRKTVTPRTEWIDTEREGKVDVKVAMLGDEVVSMKAEFDHCRIISLATDVPIQTVAEQAVRRAREQLEPNKLQRCFSADV